MDNRTDRIHWAQATTPYTPRTRPIREKHYTAKADQVPRWQAAWNSFLTLAGWALMGWLMYETLSIFLGGGYGR
jgi:hypothetical protein